MQNIIPFVMFIPLVFAIFSFVFKKHAQIIGVSFSIVWFLLAVLLIFDVYEHKILIYNFGGFEPPLGITFETNGLSSVMILVSSILILVCSIYGYFYLKEAHKALFYPLVAFLSLGLSVVFLSTDIFNLYVSLEIIGLSAVALSVIGGNKDSITSAISYLFATLIGSGFYLLGVALIYANYGILDIGLLSQNMYNDFTTSIAFVLILIGLCLKTALFPFHYWLPKAHANALTPISSLLSAIVVKTSFYLLFILTYKLFYQHQVIIEILGYIGAIAIIYGGIQAFVAKDLKLMIAYSTVSQIGYLFIVFALSSSLAFNGALFAILSHSFAKAGLFLASGVIILVMGSKNVIDLKGISSVLPFSVFTIALSAVSLIGLPPSLGFISKWYYLQESIIQNNWIIFGCVIVGGIISAMYLFKILLLALQPSVSVFVVPTSRGFRVLQWCAFVLSLLGVVCGFFAFAISSFVGL